jgi:hypothetical protein
LYFWTTVPPHGHRTNMDMVWCGAIYLQTMKDYGPKFILVGYTHYDGRKQRGGNKQFINSFIHHKRSFL